ncbi:MAG: nitronate monooxygenase [Bryobacteraceae bacterium]|nr:nitronate monooxygenase [Solibacteraceae bacterium]MCL4843653.1 nitronate monooxygenase [Bryobacteraceae bacterium]MCO5351192.1 nitronate monooxygenase [Bryobacteraceae bacterium]
MSQEPTIIQGGMGSGVSNWRLARAVSERGQLGVVSGTALDQILGWRLQDGDPGGHMRRALAAFPIPAIAKRVLDLYFIEGGKAPGTGYKRIPMPLIDAPPSVRELTIAANFVEVWLAKETHSNPVGINYLDKLQLHHLPATYGAMLAGVDYVLMGAGIPLKYPAVLDAFANHQPAAYPLNVTGAQAGDDVLMRLDPKDYLDRELPPLKRPKFLAIVASNTLAQTMLKKANGRVDGLIVEGPTAGGHNAPPRGALQLSEKGEPVYGERDIVDLAKLAALGVPFWLAGGYGTAGKLREALAAGATGIQVGTAFAYCEESGLDPDARRTILADVAAGKAHVFTDPLASPTGFPFKVVTLEGSNSEKEVYDARPRVCDLGYLREAYRTPDGEIGYRCPAEPVTVYVSKGGTREEAEGRKCLCNGLMANISLPQMRGKYLERPLVTSGDGLEDLTRFLRPGSLSYSANDVLDTLLAAPAES